MKARLRFASVMMMLLLMSGLCRGGTDSAYSNEWEGVRLRAINLDTDKPSLRIENRGSLTLAIHGDMSLTVTFFKEGEQIWVTHEQISKTIGDGSEGLDRTHNAPGILLLGPESALEIPLRQIEFNFTKPGSGYWLTLNWGDGLKCLPKGKYNVRFTTQGAGITILDRSEILRHFDIPEFAFEVR